ncbi:hypothetical protein [Actinosynnema sp. ALI-1.44]|uniref:hypothetical protein n=1 Tax=Actinosynnema sp. ALI-1.44 TaxID=1933779 RepID=UPI001177FDB6|nr:hypothetical protein [Actinosynnema sp. ALI-1.44]
MVSAEDRVAVLEEIEQRVRWLATAVVDHANRVRPNPTGLKVGGHQASSASMTTLMTAHAAIRNLGGSPTSNRTSSWSPRRTC